MQCEGELKGLGLHKGRKSNNSKCVGTLFNAIGSIFKIRHAPCLHDHVTGHVIRRHSFILEPVRESDSPYHLPYGTPYLYSLLYFTLLYSLSPFYLDKFIFLSPNSLPFFFRQSFSELEKLIPSRILILYSWHWRLNSVQTVASVLACADSPDELRF